MIQLQDKNHPPLIRWAIGLVLLAVAVGCGIHYYRTAEATTEKARHEAREAKQKADLVQLQSNLEQVPAGPPASSLPVAPPPHAPRAAGELTKTEASYVERLKNATNGINNTVQE